MTPSPPRQRALLATVAKGLLLVFLGWLYGGDVVRWGQAQVSEVTALSELPRLWLGLLGSAVTIGGAAVLVLARQKPASWQPARLFTISALALLFLDFVVLNSRRSPLSSEEQGLLAVQHIADSASAESAPEGVLRDPSVLNSFLKELGAVPFFVKGERVEAWHLELRERCAGPDGEAGSAAPGTLIYCVASNRKQAWVTLVGTPNGEVFGKRAVVSTQDGWVGTVHVPTAEPAEPQEELPPEPVWGAPTQVDP
jgi:hypothetical protein